MGKQSARIERRKQIKDAEKEKPIVIVKQKGVYSTQFIPSGTRICYYSGVDLPTGSMKPGDFRRSFRHPQKRNMFRVGHKTPKTELGVAQLINDPDIPILTTKIRPGVFRECEKRMEDYERTIDQCNVVIDSDFWAVSTRDIQPNEQLQIHWGRDYWISVVMVSAPAMWKLVYAQLGSTPLVEDFDTLRLETCDTILNRILRWDRHAPEWSIVGVNSRDPDEEKVRGIYRYLGALGTPSPTVVQEDYTEL